MPAKPTGFSVTATGRAFRLRAAATDGGSAITKWQYRIAASAAALASASWTDIASSAGDALDFTTGNIGFSATRHFQVRAVNAEGEGPASDAASATTAAPTVTVAVTVDDATPTAGETVRFTATVGGTASGAIGYQWQRLSGSSWSNIAGETGRTYDHTRASAGAVSVRCRATRQGVTGTSAAATATWRAPVITTDTDSIYIAAASSPATPTGGEASETQLPAGWSRTEPDPTTANNVYRSQRTRRYSNGAFVSASAWRAPAKVADALPTTDTDSIYIVAASGPETPDGGGSNADYLPAGWSRTEPAPTAIENVYRSQRTRTWRQGTFVSASAWGAPARVADATGITTNAEIVRGAMGYIGQRYDPQSAVFKAALFRLPEIRDRILYDMRWAFATAILALEEAPLPRGAVVGFNGSRTYAKAFAIPDSIIRVLGLNADNREGHGARGIDTMGNFIIAGNLLLTDRSSEGAGNREKLAVWAIRKVADPHEWDPVFASLVTMDLALAVGFYATTDPAVLEHLAAQRDHLYRSALTANAQENAPTVLASRSGYVEARYQRPVQEARNILAR